MCRNIDSCLALGLFIQLLRQATRHDGPFGNGTRLRLAAAIMSVHCVPGERARRDDAWRPAGRPNAQFSLLLMTKSSYLCAGVGSWLLAGSESQNPTTPIAWTFRARARARQPGRDAPIWAPPPTPYPLLDLIFGGLSSVPGGSHSAHPFAQAGLVVESQDTQPKRSANLCQRSCLSPPTCRHLFRSFRGLLPSTAT